MVGLVAEIIIGTPKLCVRKRAKSKGGVLLTCITSNDMVLSR